MKPISRRKTTKDIVYDELKKAILNGSIGTREILTETTLSETLNTSRTPIREAVADLMRQGLLVQIPRKGFHVREVSEGEKEQILFLRQSIESEGLRKLAPNITEEQIKELENFILGQERAMLKDDRVQYIELDQVFHRKILEFANQNLLEQIFQEVYNLTRLIGHNALMKKGRMSEVIQEHNAIISALKDNDKSEAANSMMKHLEITNANGRSLKE